MAQQRERETGLATRGIVLVTGDLRTLDWPTRAHAAGLTTIATHITPSEVRAFLAADDGHAFLARCEALGIAVEHELHAMGELLPRSLFERDPSMFRMDETGCRLRDDNLCVHSEAALEIVCENALRCAEELPSSTGRHFYWIDDGCPMCRCPQCRGLSDSDQALLLENRIITALRTRWPGASLAHLVYANTLEPPGQLDPCEGVFLEFAPIGRARDRSIAEREAGKPGERTHGELLDLLDANLELFGRETAQVLEYWLDCSLFSGWDRANPRPVPWFEEVFQADLEAYTARGIRHITTFGAWLDSGYVARYGEPPLEQYGRGLRAR